MSPEQALGEKIDRRSDIYSLGCMMYEAVSGKPPFDAENAFVSITKRLTEDPEPLPDDCVDDKLRQIIMQALKRDKEHRQQSVERVLNQLDLRRAGRSLQEARSQREINQNQTTEPKQESQPIEGAGPEQVENSNQGERRPKVSPKASSGWQPWKQPSLRRSFGAQSSPLELSLPRLSAGSLIVLASIGFFLAFTRTNMVDRYAGQTPQQLLVLGDQNRDDKKYAESENVLKAALDKVDSQAPKDLSMRANIEWRLGVTDFLQGKGADAERVLKNAETDARASGNKLALAHTLNWQGLLQMQRGNHEAAAQLFHDSGNMFLDTSGRNAITAERFVFEANEWLQVHQTKPAREALIQAREIYQSAGEPGRAEGLTTRISALDSPLETSN
jgi:tetratricopeptide (TPR) repeat protein